MGVYIKGMEMPPHCFNCSTKVDPDNRRCNIDGHIFEETLGKLTCRRDDACPLTSVVTCGECKYCIKKDEHELWCNGFCNPARLVRKDDFCSRGSAK